VYQYLQQYVYFLAWLIRHIAPEHEIIVSVLHLSQVFYIMSKKVYNLTIPEDLSVIRSYLQEDDNDEDFLEEDCGEESDRFR
jgi:hypothetical protein